MSTAVKKLIIEHDELEKDERRVLNYGHIMGHALESVTNYFIPHIIAVLYGILNDKKNKDNKVCFILLKEVGVSIFVFKELDEINEQLRRIFYTFFKHL